MPTKLTTEILTAAVLGFEEQKRRIDTKIAELRATLSGGPANPAATPEATSRKRKKFSAAARRKMAQSQKLRWAKIRGESEPSAPAAPEAPKPKRRISEEGMKRIIAATKKRWRLQKAKSATAKKAVTRKATAKKAAVKAAKSATAPAQAVTEAAAQ